MLQDFSVPYLSFLKANLAQMAEHFIRNERVVGSIPIVGSGIPILFTAKPPDPLKGEPHRQLLLRHRAIYRWRMPFFCFFFACPAGSLGGKAKKENKSAAGVVAYPSIRCSQINMKFKRCCHHPGSRFRTLGNPQTPKGCLSHTG